VNDRGPFQGGRLIDVSRRTAEVLGFEPQGEARVHVRYLGPAPKRVAQGEAQGAAVEASPAVAAPRPSPQGAFVVQVGAFSDPANVARVRSALETAGEVMVDVRASGERTLHRVRLGAWGTRTEAEAARDMVASLGFPGAIVAMR
jgi:rare lipoprotein A